MNIRSIQDDEVFDMWVGSLIICCKPNCIVTFLISFPVWLVLSWEYQFFDLAFKSPVNTIMNGLFWHKLSKFDTKLSMIFSNSSWVWLGDLYKEIKLQILPPIFNSKLIYSWNRCNRCSTFCSRCKHHSVYCWKGDRSVLSCTLKSPNYHCQK